MAVRINIYNRSLEKRKRGISDWKIPSTEKLAFLRFLDDLALGKVNRGRKISEVRQWKYIDVLKPSLVRCFRPRLPIELGASDSP